MHRYACRPAALGGVCLTTSPALPRQSWLRRLARHAVDFSLALALVWSFMALCAALEG